MATNNASPFGQLHITLTMGKKSNMKNGKKSKAKAAGASEYPARCDFADENSAEDTTLVVLENPRLVVADIRMGLILSSYFLYLPAGSRDCVFVGNAPTIHAIKDDEIWDGPPPARPSSPCYRVAASTGKGLGLFAQRDIAPGELILEERPVFVAPLRLAVLPDQNENGVFDRNAVSGLSPASRAAIMALHNAFSQEESCDLSGILRTNTIPIDVTPNSDPIPRLPSFVGCFPTIARVNHSCTPSATYHPASSEDFAVQLRATRQISSGEEITISYCRLDIPALARQAWLRERENFSCKCATCTLPSALLAQSDERRKKLGIFIRRSTVTTPSYSDVVEAVGYADAENLPLAKAHALFFLCGSLTEIPGTSPTTMLRALKDAREAFKLVGGEKAPAIEVLDKLMLVLQFRLLSMLHS